MESDIELWRKAAAGSRDAFGALFERHARSIYTYCFRRTADWSVAEDLTSAVFLEAWRRRAEVTPGGESILPWLFGVATNLLRNQRRSLRRYSAALSRLPRDSDMPDFSEEVAERLNDESRMRSLLEILHQLPQHQRDVLTLYVWMGLSYEETSVALGIPIGTVRSRIFQARRKLRELLGSFGHDSDRDAKAGKLLTRRVSDER